MPIYKTQLGQDSEGRYRRSLGKHENGKQHLFRLGRNKEEAERRCTLLESTWR